MPGELQITVDGFVSDLPGVRLSCSVIDVGSGATLAGHEEETVRPVASVGKLILLAEVAERMVRDPAFGDRLLERSSAEPVSDSGLWQHLRTDRFPVIDLAALVGALSDNLAANVLLQEVGLAAVERRAMMLRLRQTRLHDFVRDERTDAHPPQLSSGTSAELAALMRRLWANATEPGPERQVIDWLRPGLDHSMVAGAFGLDPLSHIAPDRGFVVVGKSGADEGVRADAGIVATDADTDADAVAYAVTAQWPVHDEADAARTAVLAGFHKLGLAIRDHLERAAT